MDTYSAGEVTDNWSPRPVDQSRFGTDPQSMIWQLRKDAFAIPPKEIAEIQLTALRGRFEELVQKIPVLKRLADEQGVTKINRITNFRLARLIAERGLNDHGTHVLDRH